MKLSEMRNCDACGKNMLKMEMFYVVRSSTAFVSPRALQQIVGIASIFGGLMSLPVAESFSPNPEVVVIVGDQDKSLMTEVFLCQDCYMESGPLINAIASQEEKP